MGNYIIHMEDGNVLYHFGVKGMKWGIRRYQNEDGSLTKRGQKRADRDARKLSKVYAATGPYSVYTKKVLDKLRKKYEGTSISDIGMRVQELGDGYYNYQVLMGRWYDFTGDELYQVIEGTVSRKKTY